MGRSTVTMKGEEEPKQPKKAAKKKAPKDADDSRPKRAVKKTVSHNLPPRKYKKANQFPVTQLRDTKLLATPEEAAVHALKQARKNRGTPVTVCAFVLSAIQNEDHPQEIIRVRKTVCDTPEETTARIRAINQIRTLADGANVTVV